ncbi:aminodeoxychorismate synthase component I [Streptomyces sp. DT2A-34]|uniref:aminodeoxychorismate synthase component I n=1 Tax=Streptomyces sp. DT2A-34 TaxID=3051182 RepID=UPI00265C3F4A|nr:aminodeoxychorismate synthase component I [Streptomyces sp. DT2A-34]MDO0912323.1 aminodeoxychorismate synthase component I [Streptomyces sp. DT2A-34]
MKTLLIDNYDSYTYNLFQLIAEVNGEEPVVVLNDAPADEVPDLGAFDNVMVSPGPGHPGAVRDFGISARVLAASPVPVLGVCLGHQGIALGEGGHVVPAPEPRHGHLSVIRHDERDLFQGLPQNFTAVRYHSLAVREPLPENLEATAWAEDGVLMGLRHRSRPLWGVQFHPESVLTDYGHRMLVNFRNLTAERARKLRTKNTAIPAPDVAVPRPAATAPHAGAPRRADTPADTAAPSAKAAPATVTIPRPRRPGRPAYRLHTRRITTAVDTEAAFTRMYAGSPRAFWLDSSLVEEGRSRFSFFGDDSGPLAEFVRYDVDSGRCEIERAGRPPRKVRASVFDYLKRQLTNRHVDATGLPFDFTGGYVGYFGYEMKADCGSPNRHRSEIPDSCWLFADRLIAVDHEAGFTYAVCLAEDTPQAAREAADWLESALAQLTCVASGQPSLPVPGEADPGAAEPWLVRDRATYLADIDACRRELRAGTSYEICLTNAARLPAPPDAYDFYRTLRRVNPAPYAAFLRFGDLDVAGSSPERFLRVGRDGVAEARPIKGTAPRGSGPEEDARLRDALAADAKTRAENLMIVDLLRNDLGRVCRTGTVRVSRLMATETYATVHQLVSTVEGRLRTGTDVVDCVRACFPGGSMTGAPKLRTMEIIDSLETEARGVYSGALGYLGCSGGADLSIVIRTAVLADGLMQLGAGGAIVLDSDPVAEYDEMLLKTAAPMRALHQYTADRIREQRERAAVRTATALPVGTRPQRPSAEEPAR